MDLRTLLATGTGIGIQIGKSDLEIVVARVRPNGVRVPGHVTIARFRERPALEWGGEYADFIRRAGAAHVSATVLLPRSEVLVRHIALPGVAGSDLAAAVSLQLDSLHPYAEEEAVCGWTPIGGGNVLIGIVRRPVLERYIAMFGEAGIRVCSFTFSAAALHAATRIYGAPEAGFVAVGGAGTVEVYGESPARPVFSAEFDLAAERAAALATAELRLAGTEPKALTEILPAPVSNPVENDLSRNALAYATALAGACPRLAPAANLLPPEHRSSSSRTLFLPTAVLAALLVLVCGALLGWSAIEDRRYLRRLESEIGRLERDAAKASTLEKQIDKTRARMRLLDDFRGRTRADLDALNELTKLLPPPIWTNLLELTRDTATISGEAEQAAGLIKVIDASPLFQNSEFNVIARTGNNENFRIRTQREGRR